MKNKIESDKGKQKTRNKYSSALKDETKCELRDAMM